MKIDWTKLFFWVLAAAIGVGLVFAVDRQVWKPLMPAPKPPVVMHTQAPAVSPQPVSPPPVVSPQPVSPHEGVVVPHLPLAKPVAKPKPAPKHQHRDEAVCRSVPAVAYKYPIPKVLEVARSKHLTDRQMNLLKYCIGA